MKKKKGIIIVLIIAALLFLISIFIVIMIMVTYESMTEYNTAELSATIGSRYDKSETTALAFGATFFLTAIFCGLLLIRKKGQTMYA